MTEATGRNFDRVRAHEADDGPATGTAGEIRTFPPRHEPSAQRRDAPSPSPTSTCSVIIPTYNRAGLLRHTLDSLVRQSLPDAQYEVIVIDDGSSDSTADVVEEYRERLNLHYFFQEDKGWRVAEARNIGIAHAEGEVCVFVDSGVVLHSDCLGEHLASHEAAAGPIAVCGYTYGFLFDKPQLEQLARSVDFSDADADIEMMRDTGKWADARELFYSKYGDEFSHVPAPWVMYWTCNASARTAQLRSVGAFDVQIRSWGGGDIDLGYRLYLDGAGFMLNRAAAAVHYPHYRAYDEPETRKAANVNYRYMAAKYNTPITRLLRFFDVKVHPFNINQVAENLKLPRCPDYLRAQNRSA